MFVKYARWRLDQSLLTRSTCDVHGQENRMDVDSSSGEIKTENSCIVLESDDDEEDDDCAMVMKSEDDDLIFVGMSPATISGDEDENGGKESGKATSDDEDIVFISRSSPQVEVIKTESTVATAESETEPSGFTGYDPFGKDSTDGGSWLDQTSDTSPLPADKPCGWVSSGDLNTPILPDLSTTSADNTLNTPTVVNVPSDLNVTDDLASTSITDSSSTSTESAEGDTTTLSGTMDSSNSDATKMDTTSCDDSSGSWLLGKCGGKPCTSSLDDPCQSSSVLLNASKDPMISGQSSDTVDSSAISSLLHQLKSLADCSNSTLSANPVTPTRIRISSNCGFSSVNCQPKQHQSCSDDLPSVKYCRNNYCKAFLKGCRKNSSMGCRAGKSDGSSNDRLEKCKKGSFSALLRDCYEKAKKQNGADMPRMICNKKKKKYCSGISGHPHLRKSKSSLDAVSSQSDDSDSDTSTRVNCSSSVGSLSDFPTSSTTSSDGTKTNSSSSCSYVVSSCSSRSGNSGLKVRLRLLGGQKQSGDKMPLMPPKARFKLSKQSFSGSDGSQALCSSCGKQNSENLFSTCLQGHFTCKCCLEKSAKELLTNSKKGSLRCTYANCDSLFSRDALRQTLPTILVEILEERLDKEAVDMVLQANKPPQQNGGGDNGQTSQSGEVKMETDESCSSSDESGKAAMEENKNKESGDMSFSGMSLPTRWQPMDPNPKDGYILVPLAGGCEEYLNLAIQFHNTMFFPRADIKRIYRVQNPILWQFFCVKKSQMQQQMRQEQTRDSVDERLLFHGTSADAAHPICKSGFDWRLCGVHGTAYGQGSYFARDASYSHMYTEQRNGPVASKDLLSSLMRRGARHGVSIQSIQAHIPTATTSSQRHSLARRLGALLALQAGSASLPAYATYHLPQGPLPVTINNLPTSAHSSGQPMNLSTSQPLNLSVGLSPQGPVPSTSAPTASTSYHPSSGFQGSNLPCERTDSGEPVRVMFVARVLVGQYAQGKNHYRKPPPLYHPYGRCFDSCVDNTSDPKIIVIFESSQCYPEYIIEYVNKARPQPVNY